MWSWLCSACCPVDTRLQWTIVGIWPSSLKYKPEIRWDHLHQPSYICFFFFVFFSFFFKFDVTWLRLRLSLSALGQVDRRRRKQRCPRFQSPDGDVRGQQLGESHCQQWQWHDSIFSGSEKVTHSWNGSTHKGNFLSFQSFEVDPVCNFPLFIYLFS